MRLFQLPNWHKQMLNATYEDEMLSHGMGNFDYDAFADGTFYFTAFDCNLVRLFRFKSGAEMYATGSPERRKDITMDVKVHILCFPEQYAFLRAYMPKYITFGLVAMEDLEELLGIEDQGGIL